MLFYVIEANSNYIYSSHLAMENKHQQLNVDHSGMIFILCLIPLFYKCLTKGPMNIQ